MSIIQNQKEPKPSKVSIDHIGFITQDICEFERFWCDKLGFKNVWQSFIPKYKMKQLFGIQTMAICRRYQLDEAVVEIHYFPIECGDWNEFEKFGINHFCLHVEDREKFCLDHDLKPILFSENNQKNYFLRDYEGNWIELRETL